MYAFLSEICRSSVTLIRKPRVIGLDFLAHQPTSLESGLKIISYVRIVLVFSLGYPTPWSAALQCFNGRRSGRRWFCYKRRRGTPANTVCKGTKIWVSSYLPTHWRISSFLDYPHLTSFACDSKSYSTFRIWNVIVIDPLLKNFPIYPSVNSKCLTRIWRM